MADELKPPVAIRITRPYATETEFLEREFDTLTHTSVILLGAQARPQGVVLRFEIVLTTGESMLRGEGRVVGYKERAYGGEPGLSLRFTRLDSRSKTLVDRASSLREARVRASTSLMSMPAVVVPRPAAPAQAPAAPGSNPTSLDASPRLAGPVSPAAAAPSRPSSPPSPPSSRRAGPPALPGWAKLGASRPISPPVDIESTQVDAHFDLPPPVPQEERELPASSGITEAAVSARDRIGIELPPLELPPVEAPAAARGAAARPSSPPPVRAPIRPTPARPPPLPRSVPPIARGGQVAETTLTTMTAAALTPNRPRDRGALERPTERDALLVRLRLRAGSLPRSRIAEILTKPARS